MITLFGASSDIGRRASARLLDSGAKLRLIAHDPSTLDNRAELVVGNISMASAIIGEAEQVISCAHARFVPELIERLPSHVRQVVLIGSAWRYSSVPNAKADEVRRAEQVFLSSGRNGVLLHPTMIYGGAQENNIRRLLAAIRRWPVLPVPAGGRHLVQPVHIEDVVSCIVAAVARNWNGPHVIPVAGPKPMPWREMALDCIGELGRRRALVSVPIVPLLAVLKLSQVLRLRLPIEMDVLFRFREDVNLSTTAMKSELGVTPRAFAIGLRQALAEWQNASPSDTRLEPRSRV